MPRVEGEVVLVLGFGDGVGGRHPRATCNVAIGNVATHGAITA